MTEPIQIAAARQTILEAWESNELTFHYAVTTERSDEICKAFAALTAERPAPQPEAVKAFRELCEFIYEHGGLLTSHKRYHELCSNLRAAISGAPPAAQEPPDVTKPRNLSTSTDELAQEPTAKKEGE